MEVLRRKSSINTPCSTWTVQQFSIPTVDDRKIYSISISLLLYCDSLVLAMTHDFVASRALSQQWAAHKPMVPIPQKMSNKIWARPRVSQSNSVCRSYKKLGTSAEEWHAINSLYNQVQYMADWLTRMGNHLGQNSPIDACRSKSASILPTQSSHSISRQPEFGTSFFLRFKNLGPTWTSVPTCPRNDE